MANLILTIISQLKNDSSECTYKTDDMGGIKGTNTNDAPVKYLLKKIHEKSPDEECKIIAITTQEAETAFDALKTTLENCGEDIDNQKYNIEKVKYEGTFSKVITEITNIAQVGDKIYIDTTGGFRDLSYLLMIAVRILEYSGVQLEKAVYSVYDKKDTSKNQIVDRTNLYNMFDLINATNSFTSLGNSDELENFFKEHDDNDLKDVIQSMRSFSDEVALCRTSKLGDILEKLNKALKNIQKLDTSDENEILFKSLAEVIKSKFQITGDTIEYPDVIRWCLENKMIQQAVTIYVEKMPEYLFKKGIISISEEEKHRICQNSQHSEFNEYYQYLYDGFLKQNIRNKVDNALERLLKNDQIFEELSKIERIDDFSGKDSLTENERKGLSNLLLVKNAIYTPSGERRNSEEIEKYKQNMDLNRFDDLFEKPAKTVEKMLNTIRSQSKLAIILQEITFKIWKEKEINTIENMEHVLKNNNEYSINIDVNKMKIILSNLVYIKRYIRNPLSHASEKENDQVKRFNKYYRSKNRECEFAEISVDDIKKVIEETLNQLPSQGA